MLTVRHIRTTRDAEGVVTPVLDERGEEIEEWSVVVPSETEADGGEAIVKFVAEELARRAAPAAALTVIDPHAPQDQQEPTS